VKRRQSCPNVAYPDSTRTHNGPVELETPAVLTVRAANCRARRIASECASRGGCPAAFGGVAMFMSAYEPPGRSCHVRFMCRHEAAGTGFDINEKE
jgi:hypothetical protein